MRAAAVRPQRSSSHAKKKKGERLIHLVVDKNSEAYKTAMDAYKEGKRVKTKGMSREEFGQLLRGK